MKKYYKPKDFMTLLGMKQVVGFLMIFGTLLVLPFGCISEVNAQGSEKFKLSGKVVDSADKAGLPGATITVKGTTSGTISDLDGNYSLEVSSNDVLVISYVGFIPQEIVVDGKSFIETSLSLDVANLEEVVVIGYGESSKQNVSSSISSIKGDEIMKTHPSTIEQALQGKVPGMVVQQISGQPGGGVSVQIRGISSFSGNTQPLYVIDGVMVQGDFGGTANLGTNTNPLAGINPSEIESIDVLKDASATAIYGSQATNGVVIITTKRGKAGAPNITYDFYTGFQQLPGKLPTMNLKEFATFINERNTGAGWGFDERPEFVNPQYLGKGTDWQDEMFQNAPMSNHSLTVSGGDSRTQYMLSGAFFSQDGIATGSKFNRSSVRVNLDNKATDWLKIGTSLQLINIDETVTTSSDGVIRIALSQTPDIPVRNADGSWGGPYNTNGWVQQVLNPLAIATINTHNINRKQMWSNVYAEIAFTKDLKLRNEATGNFSMATEDRFQPTYEMGIIERTINEGSYNFSQSVNTVLRNFLTYSKTFARKYDLIAMGGHEALLNKFEGSFASRQNFPSNSVQAINAGDPTSARNEGSKGHNAMESYFGRLDFIINDKYIFQTTIRNDGNSKYSEENRWIMSYSGSFAWKMQNENFLQSVKEVNEMKLRAGYGLTNRSAGRDFVYTSTLGTVPTGISPVSQINLAIGNPAFGWEQTKYANVGLDGALFNWRISFSVDFYNRKTDGLAMQSALPMYSGTAIGWSPGAVDAPWVNVGSMSNKGFDFRISSTNVRGKNFTWKTDVTVSHNTNKVLRLNTEGASIPGGYANGANNTKTVVGRSIGSFYGYLADGVFATAEDFETYARPTRSGEEIPIGTASGSIWLGDLKFKDLNGDGVIDELDQTFIGSPIPKYQFGLNNSFSYKNFDVNIFFSGNYGNKVLNVLRINGENPGANAGYFKAVQNYARLGLIDPEGSDTDINNVYVINPDTDIPGIRNDNTNGNNRTTDKYIEDGSFIRCKTIALGYTLSDKHLLDKMHINSLRVYANVSNAFILTKYKGMDPEVGSWDPTSAGIDSGFYPQSRVFTIGANLTFNK
ncbi:MAG: TonB-dependent receptor [Cyclobacteriaceae bacterium]